uniref:THUMP domain-containing protein n=1 Tax=Pan paniscus TaxID=9597 RepID=A0A2R8Z6S1_PANPA
GRRIAGVVVSRDCTIALQPGQQERNFPSYFFYSHPNVSLSSQLAHIMAAAAQQPPQPGGGKHRGKAQYVLVKRARHCESGGPSQPEPGLRRKCVEEAYNLLNEYGDDMYGPEKFTDKDQQPSGSEGEDDDVEAVLKKEVGDIEASTEMSLRGFQSVESGANNVAFIRTLGKEPEKLVHHILQDEYKTKKTQVILRMLPISGTCKAFLEDMKKYAETFLEPWFKAPNKGTFQIVTNCRHSHMNREVIKKLAGIVCTLNSENKVALTNPHVLKDYMYSKSPSQLNSKQRNGKEGKLEAADKSDQNNTAEGKNNQQVPENTEELGQKRTSNPQVINEGGAKPELASQATEGSKSNENDLS